MRRGDRLLSHFASAATALARTAVGLAFAVLIGAVLIQAFARSFLPQSPIWTEELARYALLYLAAFGAGLSMRTGDLVAVDIVVEMAPPRLRRWILILAALATLGLAAAIFMPALTFAGIGKFQTAPALGWRMTWIFAAMPIMAGGLFLFAGLHLAELLRGADDVADTKREG